MTTEPLQKFGYKDSPYARPNQDWVCGHAASGQACPRGPTKSGACPGGSQCDPLQQDGRWTCTRSDLHGGRCDHGPHPDGRCGAALPPCQPKRSIKARRRLVTRWIGSLAIGVMMLMLGSHYGMAMLEPGPRVHAHAQLGSCEICHAAVEHPVSLWPRFAFSGAADDSQRCLQCHTVGASPRQAHGLPAATRTALAPEQARGGGLPSVMAAGNWLVDPDDTLECGQCHQEHQGNDADLTAMSNARCQSCHSNRFVSFSGGHPDFTMYPAQRRTRIRFDHAEHLAKYFPEEGELAPQSCADCHVTAREQGLMVLRGFEPACAGCHAGDIAGAGRADSPGLAVLQVPGFDLTVLRDAGLDVGAWPEFAESRGGPFFASLMQGDAEVSAALARLEDVDWLDLEAADRATLEAAHRVIQGFKELLRELKFQGPMRLLERLVEAGRIPEDTDLKALMGGLSVNTIDAAIAAWCPDLDEDWTDPRQAAAGPVPQGTPEVVAGEATLRINIRDGAGTAFAVVATLSQGERVDILGYDGEFARVRTANDDVGFLKTKYLDVIHTATSGAGPGQLEAEEPAEEESFDAAEFDDLFGGGDDLFSDEEAATDDAGGLFGDGDDINLDAISLDEDDGPAAAEEQEQPKEPAPLDERMRAGGWYLDDMSLRYRPTGHGDQLLYSWLSRADTAMIAETLMDSDSPGRCVKCHSVDKQNGELMVNWFVRRPDPRRHEFTRFSHASHFSLMGEDGCSACHQLNPQAAYNDGFADTDPHSFTSNFHDLDKARCASCHTSAEAGDDCTSCHNYHIGEFATTEPVSTLTHALQNAN